MNTLKSLVVILAWLYAKAADHIDPPVFAGMDDLREIGISWGAA